MTKENEQIEILEELEQDEQEIRQSTEAEIVQKYDEGQARIVIQRNDFLIPNILQMVKDRDILNLAPSYQRRKRWNDTKRSHLIESLLMNIPIPPVFLYERDLAKYEVMDGQQRMDTIRAFFKNEFTLRNLKKWVELNGKHYSDLPSRIQAGLNRRGLAAVIILTESGQSSKEAMEIRQYVFERLNTGGEKLNPQEIRNCIYASPFNDILVEIARSELFTSAWDIPPKEPDEPHRASKALEKNRLYSTMADCEIVLRFFSMIDMEYFKGGMRKSLNDCMIRMKSLNKKDCELLKKQYSSLLQTAKKVYGDFIFRLPNKSGELMGRHSVPLSDAILVSIYQIGKRKASKLICVRDIIVSETKKALLSEHTYQLLVGRANTKSSIQDRILLITKIFKKALRQT